MSRGLIWGSSFVRAGNSGSPGGRSDDYIYACYESPLSIILTSVQTQAQISPLDITYPRSQGTFVGAFLHNQHVPGAIDETAIDIDDIAAN
jgi:hypothetical protein